MHLQASLLHRNQHLRDEISVWFPVAENVDVPSRKTPGALVVNVRKGTINF